MEHTPRITVTLWPKGSDHEGRPVRKSDPIQCHNPTIWQFELADAELYMRSLTSLGGSFECRAANEIRRGIANHIRRVRRSRRSLHEE